MSDAPAAISDIVEGAMVARVVEPDSGEAPNDATRGGEASAGHAAQPCLNCGTSLLGAYCHACGQPGHLHRTLAAFFHDLLHGLFHFEGKIWRTLPLLVWHPGRLTRAYIEGKRARYVSPVALFLFVVFLTFALFHAVGGEPHVNPAAANAVRAQIGAQADAAREQVHTQILKLEAERRQAVAQGRDSHDIDQALSALRASLSVVPPTKNAPSFQMSAAPGNATEQAVVAAINRAIAAAKANPDLALFKLQYNAYKYSWLLIPLSVPFVWILFPFSRRYKLFDHTVFVTYSLSFMYILIATLTLVTMLGSEALSGVAAPALIFYAPFHLYRQLREAYALRRRAALWRAMLLAVFGFCVLTVWAVALLAMAFTN